MQLGFVIDQDRCIGCHACTVACKSENEVPVGKFRTWVKSIETGVFPSVSRSFLVQRCNHCSDAPCVTICPVNALEKRADGIVDVDRDACIGCRACMQACPYDALHLNEERGAVEKCHFCAHRVERGLEPACVVVCPVEAIIAGDLHDPASKAAGLIKTNATKTRRPEQRTGPNVHYIGADSAALAPGTPSRPETYMSSERPLLKQEGWPLSLPVLPDVLVVHDIDHRVEWRWPVALYLVTKGVAGGVAMLAPFAVAAGLGGFAAGYAAEILALVFTAVTCFLLVEDLTRPWAFTRMLTRPNWRSWLVRGAVVLTVFGLIVTATVIARWAGVDRLADALRWPGAIAGVAAAGYTAFLFRQCKGRDLWEGRWLLPHLIAQAALCGAACLLPFAATSREVMPTPGVYVWVLVGSALVHLALAMVERHGSHPTDNARQAAAFLGSVRLGPFHAFRDGLVIGVGLTIVLAIVFPAAAFVPALAGLFMYEHAYIRAAQLPPLA